MTRALSIRSLLHRRRSSRSGRVGGLPICLAFIALLLAFVGGCNSSADNSQATREAAPAAIPAETPAASQGRDEPDAAAPTAEAKGEKPYVPQPLPVATEKPVEPVTTAALPSGADAASASPDAAVPSPLPAETVFKPVVAMTDAHAASTKVKVGDAFPELTLSDLENSSQTLADLRGAKLTVVVFWDAQHVFAREEVKRLTRQIVAPFSEHGVRVVAINVKDDPARVRELRDEWGVQFPFLLDPDGQAFAQVASEHLPRTYLLDEQGRVLWLDLEFSQMTQRNLRNAILFHLTSGQGAA